MDSGLFHPRLTSSVAKAWAMDMAISAGYAASSAVAYPFGLLSLRPHGRCCSSHAPPRQTRLRGKVKFVANAVHFGRLPPYAQAWQAVKDNTWLHGAQKLVRQNKLPRGFSTAMGRLRACASRTSDAKKEYSLFALETLAASTPRRRGNPSGKLSDRSGGGPPFRIFLAALHVPHGGAAKMPWTDGCRIQCRVSCWPASVVKSHTTTLPERPGTS